jgi:membrane protein DedA with SNARE-associated domain/membrane-associated phospholipid phosphatase
MISDAINPILQWLNLHPSLAGLATFIISAAESVAIIGTIIPGTLMMTAIGTLAGAGVIPLYSTIMWAILGAIVGDGLSYWAGYYFKDHLRAVWPFRTNPQILESGERFFRTYGGASVLIGRFIGPVRALVPLVAGMLRMKPLRFTLANVISAIGWAPAYMFPGILLGAASLELPPDIAIHVILVFLLLSLFAVFCLWLIYRIFILVRNQINHYLDQIWEKLLYSKRFKIITSALKHHDANKLHGQLTLAFYFILTSLVFCALAFYIAHHPSNQLIVNNALFYLFRSLRGASGDHTFIGFTLLGQDYILIPVVAILTLYFIWKKYWHTAIHTVILLSLTGIGITVFKHLVKSIRPWGIEGVSGYSFPSGHTTLSTALYAGLGLLLIHAAKIKHRMPIYILIGLLILTISVSRLYLGAHWFTDVLGGWLLGAATLMLTVLSYNRKSEKNLYAKEILLVFLVSLLTLSGLDYYREFNTLKNEYTLTSWPSYTVTLNEWWQQNNPHLPFYRIGRIGIATEILNLQWLGDIKQIEAVLIQQGWEVPPDSSWIDVLHRITDVSSTEHLPLVSPLYLDKKPVLVLTKIINGDKKLVVLRLWSSDIIIQNSKLPLWVGSVGIVPRTYSWLFKYKNSKELVISSSLLFTQPPRGYDIREITVDGHLKHKHRIQKMLLIKPQHFT